MKEPSLRKEYDIQRKIPGKPSARNLIFIPKKIENPTPGSNTNKTASGI